LSWDACADREAVGYPLATDQDLEDDDDEGYVTARGRVIDVPADQVDDARNAAASCPERAIAILED
jgi:ferredoxin